MKRTMNSERGSGVGPTLLIVVGLLIVWGIWEILTGAISSGVQEQRKHDREMMQAGSRPKATPRPVNHGGVKNRNLTF